MTAPRTPDVARHEAAHAVIGVYLGLRLCRARVTPGDTWAGYTDFDNSRRRRLHLGIMFAAGPAGDGLYGIDAPPAWREDFRQIGDLYFSPSERVILIDMATRYLRGPCRRSWERVSEALLHRDLSGREIKALIVHGEALDT